MTPPPWRLTGRGLFALYAKSSAGRAGALVLVQYASSPVGPYDELMWLDLPARPWGNPVIRRIVVSQEASMTWGRRNWAIPKTLALFEWSTPNRVQVTAATGQLIAQLGFSESPWSVPGNLRWLPAPWRTLDQPALDGSGRVLTTPTGQGWLGLARLSRCDASGVSGLTADHQPLVAITVPEFTLLFPDGIQKP
ncbi:hypothetical protein GCM10008955_02820 [Deinococcus malanensis]|uniref:Acetoacetate decarboxylase n=1 Tax=Deinococcus malanensis TaxID=1706855 RepID=A0ABQ2EHU4_9DEIO|nr:hypothetical protein [Deinococcus malanensis]GGK12922.1 hypothetical protein GCM10008955_02820 [Deinococcus malanensis]